MVYDHDTTNEEPALDSHIQVKQPKDMPLDLTMALSEEYEDEEITVYGMHKDSDYESVLASSDDLEVHYYDLLVVNKSDEHDILVEIENLTETGAVIYSEYLEEKLDIVSEWV